MNVHVNGAVQRFFPTIQNPMADMFPLTLSLELGAVPIPTFPLEIVNAERLVSSVWSAETILFHSPAESAVTPAVAVAG